jgi:hypothetical protein
MGQKPGHEKVFVGAVPDLTLVAMEPVDLGLGLKVGDCFTHAHRSEGQTPEATNLRQSFGSTLIEPDDRGPQRFAVVIDVDHGRPQGGERHPRHRFLRHRALLPQSLARLAHPSPHRDGILLGPARLV